MNIEIVNAPFHFEIYGFAGVADNKDYSGTAFRLMDRMWKTVKENHLKNKGLNIWVYESGHRVFAGVELDDKPAPGIDLEHKIVHLSKYARYKHVGPYQLIQQAGQKMNEELKNKGYESILPYIEIYGHWTSDETKLETTLLMSLK